jgi:hypothetical protein
MTDPAPRRPVHVVVAVGVSAGVYAASLAAVTALQGSVDAQLAVDRAPSVAAVERVRAGNDSLERRLGELEAAYVTATGRYRAIAEGIAAHETALGALAAGVDAASGSAAALSVPQTRLPSVASSAVSTATKPVVHACTTASGKAC